MKNKKMLIILIAALVIIIAAALVFLYLVTDLFKTEQQLFYKYLAQTDIINSELIEQYELVNNKITQNNSSSNTNIDLSTTTNDMGNYKNQSLFTIKSSGIKNIPLKQEYKDFKLSSGEQEFLTLKYIKDNNTYGIMADNIVTKYLAVENSNLKSLFSKMGVSGIDIPDTIELNSEELLATNQDALTTLKQIYENLIYNNITEDKFYKINNDDKTQTLGMSLTEQEVMDLIKNILETVKNDNLLLESIATELEKLETNDVTVESLKKEIQDIIDQILDTTYANEKDFIKLELKKEGKKVLALIFESNYKGRQTIPEGMSTLNPVQSVNNKLNVVFDLSQTDKMEIAIKANDKELCKIAFSYTYNEEVIELNALIQDSGEQYANINMKYKISNYKTENINQYYSVDWVPNFGTTGYKFSINNDIALNKDETIPKLTLENSIKLNDLTSEQLNVLFTAIGNQINEVYGESISMLTMMMGI